MDIRQIVYTHLAAVVSESSPAPFPDELSDDVLLEDFWLDSVAFASLFDRIEKEVGYIPSAILEGAFLAETFGELVTAFKNESKS